MTLIWSIISLVPLIRQISRPHLPGESPTGLLPWAILRCLRPTHRLVHETLPIILIPVMVSSPSSISISVSSLSKLNGPITQLLVFILKFLSPLLVAFRVASTRTGTLLLVPSTPR